MLVGQGYSQRNSKLFANAAGDVAVSGEVLGNQHVPRHQAAFGPIGGLELGDAGQVDHVLAPGSGVVVGEGWRGAPSQVDGPVIFKIDPLKETGFKLAGSLSDEVRQTLELCQQLETRG